MNGGGQTGGAFTLTRSQYLLWMGQALAPDAPMCNMAMAFDLGRGINATRLLAAFDSVLAESDALRMVFDNSDGMPTARVLSHMAPAVEQVDFSSEQRASPVVASWLENRSRRVLDLQQCCFDAALLQLQDDHWVWYLNQHHLITDAQSSVLIYQRLLAAYFDLSTEPAPTYAERYLQEQRGSDTRAAQMARAYWQQQLEETGTVEPRGFYGRSPDTGTTAARHLVHRLENSRTEALRNRAASRSATLLSDDIAQFCLYLTALAATLYRAGGRSSVRVGVPLHNRTNKRLKSTAGLLTEIFPLQVTIAADETFSSLLHKVEQQSLALFKHGIAGTSDAPLNASFDVLFNFITATLPQLGDIEPACEWLLPGHIDTGHALRLQVQDFSATGQPTLHFDIKQKTFPAPLGDRLRHQYLALLDAMLADPDRQLDQIDLLTDDDRTAWRALNPALDTPPSSTLLDEIALQAQQHGARTAVQEGERKLSYAELESWSNGLAHQLIKRGVSRGDTVALCLPRSVELVVAVLAICKAGAAYLPLDPRYPEERRKLMIADAGARLVLADSATEKTDGNTEQLVATQLLAMARDEGSREDSEPATREAHDDDLAYVIYTSGSTGRPKGVDISHRALAAYLRWARSVYLAGEPPAEGWIMPLFTSVAFDLTVTSLFLPLISGGRLVVYPEDDSDTDLAVLRVVEDNTANIVKLTPAHLSLVRELNPRSSSIKRMILGGEELHTELAGAVCDIIPGVQIFNEYGPTEATVGCMLHQFDPRRDREATVPIGIPAAHMHAFVLDAQGSPLPVGAIGELYLGGWSLAQGYRGRADLTAASFPHDPWEPQQRVYRTGDLGSLGTDGRLRFHGRADEQLKIRGMRIEPAEVESVLLQIDGINEAVVTAVADAVGRAPSRLTCKRCGLPEAVPGTRLDSEGICSLCNEFTRHRDRAMAYFSDMPAFRTVADSMRAAGTGNGNKQDCMVLLSGGKDSTYMLYQLVEFGLTPLIFCLDNGYIADGAKANISRAADDLGLELVYGSTPAMDDVFVDSLERFSNVCNGCFKVIYTLATALAVERDIGYVVTGLSRGQIFDTRLKELFTQQVFDIDDIDNLIIESRKAYHRVDDAVHRCMDTSVFDTDDVFERVQYIDFYRYCDVELAEIYRFLQDKAPWVRPSDTGRSTNCLINDVGIWVHKNERGYHNYAEPYCWDVRLGHKQRDAAMAELDDEINVGRVRDVLAGIGYQEKFDPLSNQTRLGAYIVAGRALDVASIRQSLSEYLPTHMIPHTIMQLDTMPLTANGKVDRAALPSPGQHNDSATSFVAPQSPMERRLAAIWQAVLGVDSIGVHDDYIQLGGDSILSIQVTSRALDEGVQFDPIDLFKTPTIAELALVATLVDTQERPEEERRERFDGISTTELDSVSQLLQRQTTLE